MFCISDQIETALMRRKTYLVVMFLNLKSLLLAKTAVNMIANRAHALQNCEIY